MPDRSASPPTRRVVDIVSLLTTATEPLGTAAIAERLGIARATATAILTELVAAGWARRDPQRGFTIGPELAGLHTAALPPGVGEVLAALAARTGYGATFSRIEPDRLTVLDVRHGHTRVVPGIPVGHRIPLQFPAGASVMPWRPAAEQNTWLRAATGSDQRTASALLNLVRTRGVAVFRPRADDAGLVDLLADLLGAVGTELLQPRLRARVLRQLADLTARPYTQDELDSPDPLPLSYLAAPVFDPAGTAAYEVQLGPLQSATTKPQRDEYIAALTEAAHHLTTTLSG
ncbi:helix-turn-helix domain-containing protein [Nocardia brasiliensis]|uniref:Helix-turn-helix domain-containing protein n=1 Tax=Nocardia brasiliensis TaxID=37326 RepID=A0A6G9XRP3_NOCBR|nr:helix-turn-helix domain-containing protein [Nocardia brasiliensis]QIS03594.1 helix-turn-helix domain-containing protein [Nocardia brasiliensis]